MVEVALALGLSGLAMACLFDRHLVRACCLFLVFAVSMAMAWWRLQAPFLGLAELGLGAVLTGLSLFHALGFLPASSPRPPYRDVLREPSHHAAARALLALAWLVMVGIAVAQSFVVTLDPLSAQPLLIAGVTLVAAGLGAFALHRHLLRRLLAFNVLGSGVFLLTIGVAGITAQSQALVTVGLVVAWLGTLLGAMLTRRLFHLQGRRALSNGGRPNGEPPP
ncbi:hydrogenase subunit MbhD domain-containing protein [Halomonas sp. Bachu 37]|uniref:hydrogenase subunit MbhD domain-containing protein n=1 Tax=Halomonas kashgarensis TaxID=3084920 RepID=UPI003216FA86